MNINNNITLDLSENVLPLIGQLLAMRAKIEALIPYVIDESNLEQYNKDVSIIFKELLKEFNEKYPSLNISFDEAT